MPNGVLFTRLPVMAVPFPILLHLKSCHSSRPFHQLATGISR